MSPKIKVNELRRKHVARNAIIDKMVAKGKKSKRQETKKL